MRTFWQRLSDYDAYWCQLWHHRSSQYWLMQRGFAIVSRLGDGVFWYALIAFFVLFDGLDGLQAGLHMLATNAVGLALYKSLKHGTRRKRPCDADIGIRAVIAPLDRYSFPSGHTLHAVAFSTVALYYYPHLAWLLVPLTLLIAASRVVLGLHYPSDVLMATGIGLGLGYGSLKLLL
ncbi:phosphatase PAP2 family protein [Rhabdochromatium marinum]|uniref:phosphatase PAP2 family protein n=1 Tax=Rhabdochromatium marinum TaxID=48729 RepID=UPI0019032605|nr:phosphatase PAP2 family protein [Rhabdochromatium marinum]MBK1648748.1 phosphatase PAP2 family protein [Rhabdochromatium marinum]